MSSSAFFGGIDDISRATALEHHDNVPIIIQESQEQPHQQHNHDDSRIFPSFASRSQEGGRSIASSAVTRRTNRVTRSNSSRSRRSQGRAAAAAAGGGDGGAPPAPMESGMRVMSVVLEQSNISFAFYHEERNEITIETRTSNGYTTVAMVERFIQMTRPTLVVLGNRIVNNAALLQIVTKPPVSLPDEEMDINENISQGTGITTTEVGFGRTSSSIPYRLLKSGTYDFQKCKSLILRQLKVRSLMDQQEGHEETHHHDPDRLFPLAQEANDGSRMFRPSSYHYLAAAIDFESNTLIKALGSLLSYLQTTIFPVESGGILINDIVDANTLGCMSISSTTFAALRIFAEEAHPLIAKGQGNSKEGFSLFSLLDQTKSKGGRKLLREWMLQPLCSLEAIATRQDAVELFLSPNHQVTVGVLQNFLHATGPIDQIILRMNKCTTKPKDLFVLNRTLSTIISLASVLENEILSFIENNPTMSSTRCLQFLRKIYQELNLDVLLDLRECITSVVDEEATFARGDKPERVVIRRGYDEQLDVWREQYENLELLLEEEGSNLCQQYPQLLGLDVVFMQQVGFLVVLCQSVLDHGQVALPPDFQQVFVDEGLVYFKCEKMRELDEEIEDIDGMIKDREDLIIGELEENILDCENELKETFRAVSTLDCIIAFAGCAADFKFSRPQVVETDKPLLYIKDGRHPLLEINTGASYVANDVRINEKDRILVVTGPNYSGKSCYLRQLGLLVYMAHIGSFIPCSQATISLTDQIFARISTVETASRPQSSYQQELTEMASVFARATSKSLVLLDEVGKGTHPSSGISILGAALKKLSLIGCSTVCTTHFLELFSANVITDREDGIRALQMSIHLPGENEDNAVPLFKLENGVASSSAGLVCAKNAGIERRVLVRAKEIIQALKSKTYIEPTTEAMARTSDLTEEEKEVLVLFSSVESWEAATDGQLRSLIQKVSKIGLS